MAHILTLNAGSSSIKFAVFEIDGLVEQIRGQIEGLGAAPHLSARIAGQQDADTALNRETIADHGCALAEILAFLEDALPAPDVVAVGHRVVHGGPDCAGPVVLDEDRLAALQRLVPLAPLHQPHNLSGVRAAKATFPDAIQVGCFDTSFHRAHPWAADAYALPRSFYEEGVRRYGFHGLSYEYIAQALCDLSPDHAKGRVVVTHLGNGASMCAMRDGKSVGSTMGFTALDGLPMGTRCGQLDPGVVLYLMTEKGFTADEIEDLLYRKSGLKGLSGLSHDMRQLEAADTQEANEAIDYFVYRARRELGAMIAVLSGLDALVFCGGIGENAWRIRTRICRDFTWAGLELDEARNRSGETDISAWDSHVRTFVIRTDEELMIARHTAATLNANGMTTAAA